MGGDRQFVSQRTHILYRPIVAEIPCREGEGQTSETISRARARYENLGKVQVKLVAIAKRHSVELGPDLVMGASNTIYAVTIGPSGVGHMLKPPLTSSPRS